MVDFQSEYLRNTAVVSTVLTVNNGAAVRITDFAPRFRNFDRILRPPQLMRIIEPVAGLPRIAIRVRPTHITASRCVHHSVGSNHIRYWTKEPSSGSPPMRRCPISSRDAFRRSPVPCTWCSGRTSLSGRPRHHLREFCDRTIDYWLEWVRAAFHRL